MQAILKSIRPRHIMNIINGIKDLELSTTAPKDWLDYFNKKTDKKPDPILVLLYCTKGGQFLFKDIYAEKGGYEPIYYLDDKEHDSWSQKLNGKVIGMFTLNQIYVQRMTTFSNAEQAFEMAKRACLTTDEFFAYQKDKTIYAWKIDDLVVFDKPKELSEFYSNFRCKRHERIFGNNNIGIDKKYGGLRQPTRRGYEYVYPLTKAPQNWCYVEMSRLWKNH